MLRLSFLPSGISPLIVKRPRTYPYFSLLAIAFNSVDFPLDGAPRSSTRIPG